MRCNREIRADRVRVIAEDGSQIGVLPLREALRQAEEAGLDLVEIAPNAVPPVCKIINFGKFRYQIAKKEKESKKSQHQIKVKEIKLKPNIDSHDLNTKIKHAKEFLAKGNKVRLTLMFRGRELLHAELGEELLNKVCKELEDVSIVETPVKEMGKLITLVLAPSKKKTVAKEEKHENVQNENS